MGSPVSRGYASLLLNDPIPSPWVLFGHLQQLQPRGGSWWYLLYSPFYSIYIFARTASWRSPIKEISAFSDSHNRRTTSNFPLNMEISVKEATLVAIIIESILYGWYLHRARFLHHWSSFSQGISSFLFAVTLWSLTYQRNPAEVARSMLVAACLLFILSTMVRSLVRSTTTPYLSTHSMLLSMQTTSGKVLFPRETQISSSRISAKIHSKTRCMSWRLSLVMLSLSAQFVSPV